jgi:hypothetical protein
MQQQMKDCRLKLELYAVSQIFHHYASHEVSTTVLLKKTDLQTSDVVWPG